jgi:hypothetical protein
MLHQHLLYIKAEKVLASCLTYDQFRVAVNFTNFCALRTYERLSKFQKINEGLQIELWIELKNRYKMIQNEKLFGKLDKNKKGI